jgi:hypothetical protein
MKKILRSETIFTGIGYTLGALMGYVYYLNYPCKDGCALTSSPIGTALIGLLIGGLVFQSIFEIINPKNKKDVKNNH